MLSVNELAANVVLFNIITLSYQNSLGMSFAISNLVGNNIGGMRPKTAKRYFITSIFVILTLGIFSVTLLNVLYFYFYFEDTNSKDILSFQF